MAEHAPRLVCVVLAGCLCAAPEAALSEGAGSPSWLQWGGPRRNFEAPTSHLATTWPETGPRQIWRRGLGDGQSAVLFEAGRLYTMHRRNDEEAVICLDAHTGKTIWETAYDAEYEGLEQYGRGPRSTPLIVGDRLFTVGVSGRMLALAKETGEIVWHQELWGNELGGNRLGHGYASSPIAFGDTVIVPVGGEGAAVVAFDQKSGAVRWQEHDFRNSYSSPTLLTIAGQLQLVVFMAEELIALDPATGTLFWRWPHANQWGHNITMPIAIDDVIFFSSPQAGARGLRVDRNGTEYGLEQLWSTRRIQFYHASTVRRGDWVYGSTGTNSPAFMTAVNIRTGQIGWRQRGIAKANCVGTDDRLVILDENGVLYLAEASPEELVIESEAKLLDRYAWSVPTIVGRTMYVRDGHQIIAVDLG